MTFDLKLPDAAATQRLGAALAVGLVPGRVLHLSGELGSGKTTLVRGLLRALGVEGAVKSPTFTWVEPYRLSRLDLYHFDFYRFDKKTEWLSSGLRDYFRADAVCIVEWPERDYTRLTIESKAELKYEMFAVKDPDRLVLDLETDVTPALAELDGKVAADDPYIKGLRLARNRPGIVRVVLDLKAEVKPQAFILSPVAEYGY